MKKFVNILLIFGFTLCFNVDQPYSKEKLDNTCYKRGVEIIFPYQKGIFKIQTGLHRLPRQTKERIN